jgi:hypothetical protein
MGLNLHKQTYCFVTTPGWLLQAILRAVLSRPIVISAATMVAVEHHRICALHSPIERALLLVFTRFSFGPKPSSGDSRMWSSAGQARPATNTGGVFSQR